MRDKQSRWRSWRVSVLEASRPRLDAEAVFTDCLRRVRHRLDDTGLRHTVSQYQRAVFIYRGLGHDHRLSAYETRLLGSLGPEQLERMYRRHLRDGLERSHYDELLVHAPGGRCLYCGIGVAYTLDHYLPISRYPDLAVLPDNLVPACRDCNSFKSDFTPTDAPEELFHPYFDRWRADLILTADLNYGDSASIEFRFEPDGPARIPAHRANRHLTRLSIDVAYAIQAGTELAERRPALSELAALAGHEAVDDLLNREAASRTQVAKNSWSAALLRALVQDPGFRERWLST